MADRVTGRRAHSYLYLSVLVTDGAGQAGFNGAFPVRKGLIHTLLTHRVMVMIAVRVHALSHRTHCAGLAAAGHHIEEVVIVTDALGIVGVSAGRRHAHQAGALSARLALLCVTVVL